MSPPSQGVWIEIILFRLCDRECQSPPSQGVWIEIAQDGMTIRDTSSPPSQGVWIEISSVRRSLHIFWNVTPFTGGVD